MFKNFLQSNALVILFAICLALPQAQQAHALVIDFEGLGLSEGSSVPVIGGVTFSADIALQGGSSFAAGGASGVDTGFSIPFSTIGNTFITNPGGFASASPVKEITAAFSSPVSSLSFLAMDIDSLLGVVTEEVTASVFDAGNNLLATQVFTAPLGSPALPAGGDGEVVLFDFGALSGISRLEVINNPSFNPSGSNSIGFGIDNLAFNTVTGSPVPEPSTMLLLSTGLIGLIGYNYRRSKNKGHS